jgi:erythromycin esterase-like protein
MKTIICILLCLSSVVSKGFTALTDPHRHMPSNGHWVVEQTQKNSSRVSVYYYNVHDKVIHRELVSMRNENFLTDRLKRKLNRKLYLLLQLEAEKKEAELDSPQVSKSEHPMRTK